MRTARTAAPGDRPYRVKVDVYAPHRKTPYHLTVRTWAPNEAAARNRTILHLKHGTTWTHIDKPIMAPGTATITDVTPCEWGFNTPCGLETYTARSAPTLKSLSRTLRPR